MRATTKSVRRSPKKQAGADARTTLDSGASAAAGRLRLTVQYALGNHGLPSRAQVRRWLRACQPGAAQLTVRFVNGEEGRSFNAKYRGKDYATNVLSFSYAMAPVLEGDLVVCAPLVEMEAAQQGISSEAHFAHLIVHGMLHLQGYEHDGNDDAYVMENREREVLEQMGYPDPYRGER